MRRPLPFSHAPPTSDRVPQMQISFASNLRQVERDLSDVARRQLPFATSVALNDTALDVQAAVTSDLDDKLDKPTPFTRKAYGVRRSTKQSLEARVYAKPIQARYLSTLEDGGTRTPARRAIVTPQSVKLNQYGNLPRGAIKRQLAVPTTFSGTPKGGKGGSGIYTRRAGKLVKVISYASRATYKPTLGFRNTAAKAAAASFPDRFTRALVRAFAARR